MKYKQTTPNAKAYTFTKAKLGLPETNTTVPNVFNGKLVYLGFKDYGFQPMIKVLDTSEPLYFFPKDVSEVEGSAFNYGVNTLPQTSRVANTVDYGFSEMRNTYMQVSDFSGTNTSIGEFNSAEVEEKYKQSGSKLNFGEWIKSDQGKKLVNDSLSLAFSLLNKNNNQNTQPPVNNEQNNTPSDKGFTILKMKPLTFTLVAVGTIAAIVLAVKYIPQIKSTKK